MRCKFATLRIRYLLFRKIDQDRALCTGILQGRLQPRERPVIDDRCVVFAVNIWEALGKQSLAMAEILVTTKGPAGEADKLMQAFEPAAGRATRPHMLVALDDETEAYVWVETDSTDEAIEKIENALATSRMSGFQITGSARLLPR